MEYKIEFMKEAIDQALISSKDDNFPVGAVLVIDGMIVDKARNLLNTNSDWISHAEMNLLIKHSPLIKKSRQNDIPVEIYTTFEPCLMCLGACALHRISRIIFALPDNFTGSVNAINEKLLPVGYREIFPKIEETNSFRKESQEMLAKYMSEHKSPKWDAAKKLLEDME